MFHDDAALFSMLRYAADLPFSMRRDDGVCFFLVGSLRAAVLFPMRRYAGTYFWFANVYILLLFFWVGKYDARIFLCAKVCSLLFLVANKLHYFCFPIFLRDVTVICTFVFFATVCSLHLFLPI